MGSFIFYDKQFFSRMALHTGKAYFWNYSAPVLEDTVTLLIPR